MATWCGLGWGRKCGHIGNGDIYMCVCIYAIERTWLVLVNVTTIGGIYTGATGRRQANRMCFQSWFYCFVVTYRANNGWRVQHRVLIQAVNNLQHSPPGLSAVCCPWWRKWQTPLTSPDVLFCATLHLIAVKVIIFVWKLFCMQILFSFGSQIVVTWTKVRRIEKVL
jgi:hypothetical protein